MCPKNWKLYGEAQNLSFIYIKKTGTLHEKYDLFDTTQSLDNECFYNAFDKMDSDCSVSEDSSITDDGGYTSSEYSSECSSEDGYTSSELSYEEG